MVYEYLRPGEKVPQSGVYIVRHADDCAHSQHEVTCITKMEFPQCRRCGDRVNFTLVRYAPDVASHEFFK